MCPDTLFLYFEYDYRFYARDDLSLKEWLPFCMLQAPKGVQDAHREEMHGQATSSTAHSAEQGPPTGAMRTEGGRDDDASSSSKRPRRAGTKTDPPAFSESSLHGVSLEGLERRTGHEMPFGVDGVAPEVCDLVALCNAAHTVGRGDMVWLGWNAGFAGEKKKKPTDKLFQFGSHCIGFTKRGAKTMLDIMEVCKPTHIDLFFRDILNEGKNQEKIGASIVHPAVGSYGAQHVSMNLKGARRAAAWHHSWCQEGTREHPTAVGPNGLPYVVRGIYGWTRDNNPPLFLEVPLVGQTHKWFWRTQLPPQMLRSNDELWRELLHRRQWLWDNGDWRGPFGDKYEFACFPGKEKAEMEGKQPWDFWWQLQTGNRWRLLQEDPEGIVQELHIGVGKLTRVASELVTAPRILEDRGPTTDRENRHHRQMLQLYRRRFFVRGAANEVVVGACFFVFCV